MRYRRKPKVVEAIRVGMDYENLEELQEFSGNRIFVDTTKTINNVYFVDGNKECVIHPTNYLVKIDRFIIPMSGLEFELEYERLW